MLTLPRSVRILIGSTPIDMRKSIDGLTAIVRDELEEDVYSGHLFVFVSRRRDRVKILAWDKGGFVLSYASRCTSLREATPGCRPDQAPSRGSPWTSARCDADDPPARPTARMPRSEIVDFDLGHRLRVP